MSAQGFFDRCFNLFVFFDVGEYEMMKYLLNENSLVLTFGTSISSVAGNTNLERRQILTLESLGVLSNVDKTWDRQTPLSEDDVTRFKRAWVTQDRCARIKKVYLGVSCVIMGQLA
jgi:hypothetical protein